MEYYVEYHLVKSASIPHKMIKKRERKKENKEKKVMTINLNGINNAEVKSKLEEVAKMLNDKTESIITKSERAKLVEVARIVFDKNIDPIPIYEGLSNILQCSLKEATVYFQ